MFPQSAGSQVAALCNSILEQDFSPLIIMYPPPCVEGLRQPSRHYFSSVSLLIPLVRIRACISINA